jgi:hypothetical protein
MCTSYADPAIIAGVLTLTVDTWDAAQPSAAERASRSVIVISVQNART